MIESITISDVATYATKPELLNKLSQFNFFFGSNGSGKTTISRVIADGTKFPTCTITWKAGTKLQPLVYNHDFVERNFNQSTELKGVFTLGEKQLDTLAKIEAAKKERDELTTKIEKLTQGLQGTDGNGGKNGELTRIETALKEKCWTYKQKHDAKFQGGFEGYRNSSEKFKAKVMQEQASNTAQLLTLQELEKKTKSVFGLTPAIEASIPSVDTIKLLEYEVNPILKKRVIGKEDVNIAAMIKKLSNSDWVREGREFYVVNNQICPFCQQETTDKFAQSLNEYFDEAFMTESNAINDLATNYATEAARIQQQLASIIALPSKFLEVEKLNTEKELLNARIILNNQRLAGKRKEASQIVELESLNNIFTAINSLIDTANSQVATHNKMVANLSTERAALTKEIWKFILEELKVDLAEFKAERDSLDKAIVEMTTQIKNANLVKEKREAEIRELEKATTSIQPTIDGINSLLSSFGFHGLKLSRRLQTESLTNWCV